ncbi:MAG: uroporphyrinogen-III synthase [Erythrobacter sp.]
MGLDIRGFPLFEVRPCDWTGPDPASIDALLIGSANALAHGGGALAAYKDKPVHAVGAATAKAARKAGFAVASLGSGGLQNVLDAIEPPARLLRVAGAEHVALDVPDGIAIATVIAYESVALPLDPALVRRVGERPVVLLHSAAAARHFAAECERTGIARREVAIAALGPRIAEAAGEDWRAVHVSPEPSDRQLLASLADMCI